MERRYTLRLRAASVNSRQSVRRPFPSHRQRPLSKLKKKTTWMRSFLTVPPASERGAKLLSWATRKTGLVMDRERSVYIILVW
jgi:hypothetical protein